ncbi:MAG: PAS domain S-box protein [Dehalococcoidales bacterium]|nr:PAS domain S-box protein [Dehalococcoidales bacterium]
MTSRFKLTEQNYRYLFNNANDAMWVHDIEGNILVANEACEKLTGYTGEELTGMNVIRFLTDEFLDVAREVKRRLLAGEPIEQPFEQRLIRKDGSMGIVKMSTSLVISAGDAAGFQNIARDVTEEKRMQENLRFYIQQVTRAQEGERKRLARQLHDEVAPPILLLIQRLDSVESLTRPKISKSLQDKLEELRRVAIGALEGVRRCAQDLRPSILDDLGLVAALEWMADDLVKKFSIEARVEITGKQVELPAEVQLLLFRIAQEALSNVRRHAQAGAAVVRLEYGRNMVRMTVSDNGKGFEMAPQANDLARKGKLGVAGMYERANLLGGTLAIQSEPGKGTRVVTDVPLPE